MHQTPSQSDGPYGLHDALLFLMFESFFDCLPWPKQVRQPEVRRVNRRLCRENEDSI